MLSGDREFFRAVFLGNSPLRAHFLEEKPPSIMISDLLPTFFRYALVLEALRCCCLGELAGPFFFRWPSIDFHAATRHAS